MLKSSSVSGEIYTQERTDGSQSDTALGTVGGGSKKRRSSLSARVVAIVGNRRSRSTSQISGPGEWWLHIPPAVCDVNVAKCPPTYDGDIILLYTYNVNIESIGMERICSGSLL